MSHSVILGGSNAQRLLTCPASYMESMKSPVSDFESSYAAEGTMLHECITECVRRKLTAKLIRAVGFKSHLPHILNEEQEEALAKALDALEEIKAMYPGARAWRVLALEKRMTLPGVTGAFGTVDLVLANDVAVIVLDWKFGAGVPVFALYPMPDGSEQLNAQGAFYACGARAALKRQFKDKAIVVAIVQPRLDPPFSIAQTDDVELDGFLMAFGNAVLEAMGRDAYRERGEHCRFALCKATCPLFVGPVIEMSILDPAKAALVASSGGSPTEYGAFLSRALTLAEMAELWATEIRRQAHVFLEDGGLVKEWKLVPKRGTRRWVQPDKDTIAELTKLDGVTEKDVMSEPTLKSVKQVEDALKPRKIAVPPALFDMVSTGTTIARNDDARPEATRATVINDLRAALTQL